MTTSKGTVLRSAAFLITFALLQTAYSMGQGGWVEQLIVERITVGTAAMLLAHFDPMVQAVAAGPRLIAPGGGINVLAGCEGTDALFLMVGAMIVAPISWPGRLIGVVASCLFIMAVNQLRVLSLFYAFRSDRALFDLLHGFVTPALLILAAGLFFIGWLSLWRRRSPLMELASA